MSAPGNSRNRRAGVVNPRVDRLYVPGGGDPYLPHVPRTTVNQQRMSQIWPNPPQNWIWSVEEWIVYWYLITQKHWNPSPPDPDFYHQSRVYTQRLFASRDFTEADFLIPYGSRSKLGYNGRYTALVLDPFTEFTHDKGFDIERKGELDLARYRLVFLAEFPLKLNTKHVIDEALLGKDLSNRGP